MLPPKRELLIFSSSLILKGRDDENFSYSHQVNWSLKPPKQELLIFSSSQILKGEVMRTSHILIMWFEAWSPQNENFSSSHHVYQIWQLPKRELLIISSSQIFNGEKMRMSHILIKFIETSLLHPPPLPQLLLGGGEMMRFSHLHKLTKISWEDENISKVDENSRLKKASAGTSWVRDSLLNRK